MACQPLEGLVFCSFIAVRMLREWWHFSKGDNGARNRLSGEEQLTGLILRPLFTCSCFLLTGKKYNSWVSASVSHQPWPFSVCPTWSRVGSRVIFP